MSRYVPGDIVLVPFPHEREQNTKVRPALVIATRPDGDLCCFPIRSTPRAGTVCIPITIDDFALGGLDLFSESYVQTDTVRRVRIGTVIGMKGRVTGEFLKMFKK
ncbi:MAG: type II toxin-antitoxin system PemK/MazF family toxin [Methanoregula sp.]|nr:MAG: type II toxin-antitoxin system PemK/MazF family toxin [Methanoregula sp.]